PPVGGGSAHAVGVLDEDLLGEVELDEQRLRRPEELLGVHRQQQPVPVAELGPAARPPLLVAEDGAAVPGAEVDDRLAVLGPELAECAAVEVPRVADVPVVLAPLDLVEFLLPPRVPAGALDG